MNHINRHVLVTGASGLLGRQFVNYLSGKYNRVTACYQNHEIKSSLLNVEPVKIDLLDAVALDLLLAQYNPDLIIHCAGFTNVDACEENPELAESLNAKLAGAIAAFSRKNNSQYVYISTDHLFQGDQALYTEDESPRPLNVYAKTKYDGEILSCERQPESLIIRTNFFGKGSDWRCSFSDWLWNELTQRKKISAFEDSYFTPIAIPGLVSIVHHLIERKSNGIFNVCGSERLSKFDFAQRFAEYFKLPTELIIPVKVTEAALKAKRPLDMSLSTDKLTKLLGFAPPNLTQSFTSINQDYIR